VANLPGVNTGALLATGISCAIIAALVLVLPWKRHFTLLGNATIAFTLAFLVVTDGLSHYSRTPAALAVYPVFIIVVIAWTGLTRARGVAALTAAVSAPVLYQIFAQGGRSSAGWECLIVTIP